MPPLITSDVPVSLSSAKVVAPLNERRERVIEAQSRRFDSAIAPRPFMTTRVRFQPKLAAGIKGGLS